METAEVIDVKKIESDSNALIERANSFEITTDVIYVDAMEFAKKIKASIKEVEAAFDPIIKANHAAWKGAIAQKDKYLAPREKALSYLDGKGREFRAEQERLRVEEQRKAQELADKETERLRKLAEKAEARGDTAKAEEFTAKSEEAAAIVPVIAPKVTKVEGIIVRQVWKARIVDETLIPREYLIPDEQKLGAVARATKGTLKISGVVIYSEDSKL